MAETKTQSVQSPVKIMDRKNLDIKSGDTVRVMQKIAEEKTSVKANKKTEKTIKFRLQAFEGLVIAVKHGKEAGGTFTVRRVASGVGVEKIFPLYSPMIDSIEVIKRSKVRRAKLYHIREKAAKEIRRQMRNIRDLPDNTPTEDEVVEEVEMEKPEEEKVEEKA